MDIAELFARFPKQREPLPLAYQAIYEEHYKSNRSGDSTASGAAQKLEQWLHKKIARDTNGLLGHKTLEIGAGTLNQISYESNLTHYDVIEPFAALYKDSAHRSAVRRIYTDIIEVAREHHIIPHLTGGGDYPRQKSI